MPPTPTEPRIRLSCHFPNHSSYQKKAFSAFLTYLKSQKNEALEITGYTQSDGLTGQWWSDVIHGWIEDNITVITLDLTGDEDEEAFASAITDLKNYAHECYEEAGDAQEEIWITTHPLTRYL